MARVTLALQRLHKITLLYDNYDFVFLAKGSVNLSGLTAVSVFSGPIENKVSHVVVTVLCGRYSSAYSRI
jgi:hypothetical protein